MPWFKKTPTKEEKIVKGKEDLWVRCQKCSAHVFKEEWEQNLYVCPRCRYHSRLTCQQRCDLLIDKGTFDELFQSIVPEDILNFFDGKGSYKDKIQSTIDATGLNEAVITGLGRLNSHKVVISIMDFRFFGGSLGAATGEKIFQGSMYAYDYHLPYIVVSASGGARMQEGVLSLMQMAKTCNGIAHLKQKKLPYISILTDPTSGGVSASFAMMGDVNIAEPGALIAFAGRRVIEGTIKEKLPDNFQTAEYLLEKGFIDCIAERKDLKIKITQILEYLYFKKS